MDSDVEDLAADAESSSASDSSDPDFTDTVLTQLIRSGRAHILTERSHRLEEASESFSDFVQAAMPAPVESKPDVTTLKETDLHLMTTMAAGLWKRRREQIHQMVSQRQLGSGNFGKFSQGDRSVISHRYLPNEFTSVANFDHKMFCGTFSKDGDVFLSASQDRVIRVFDTSKGGFANPRSIQAQDVGWAVLDTAFSPSGRQIIYSSWSEAIHLCDLSAYSAQRHEALQLNPDFRRFCIFSLMFAHDGQQVLGGANDGCLYVYDCLSRRRTLRIEAHEDDVNCVTFADETSQILFSAGDDGLCKVWDRRTLVESCARPVGIFAGHVDGLTYVDSRGDGRHLVTNSKDQSVKLWDLRRFSSSDAQEHAKQVVRTHNWDYRWQNVPWKPASSNPKMAGDTSLMTYRGHSVLQTLIRCHFSPQFSTGQRYIYTGCAAGRVVIYDVLTGQQEAVLEGHTACVRDVSWHPHRPEIIDSAWDGHHYKWFYVSPDSDLADLQLDLDDLFTDTDSENSSQDETGDSDWVALQRRDQRRRAASRPAGGAADRVRRSPRLSAQEHHTASRRVQPRRNRSRARPSTR